jgi:hypothetical protein
MEETATKSDVVLKTSHSKMSKRPMSRRIAATNELRLNTELQPSVPGN